MCDYNLASYSLPSGDTSHSVTQLTYSVVGSGVNQFFYPPSPISASAADDVEAWLNGLGIGTFSVSNVGGILTIQSLANPTIIATISFVGSPSGDVFGAAFAVSNCRFI